METMQITVSDVLQNYLQTQASKHGFPSPKDYLQAMLAELEQPVKEKKEFEMTLLEAIRSPGIVADQAFWAERRRKILDKHPDLK